jgi:4-oxalocrotonate tautomerase
MIKKITDTTVSIEGENLRQVTIVIVEEVKSGGCVIGGRAMTTKDVKAPKPASDKATVEKG